MANHIIWQDRKRLWCGLPWTFTVYSLSEDRLFIKTGFVSVKEDEVRLYRIKDIGLTQGFFQRIFGLGTISICSSDSSLQDFKLVNVKKSRAVKEQLSQFVEKEREKKRVYTRENLNHHGSEEEAEDFDFDRFDDQI